MSLVAKRYAKAAVSAAEEAGGREALLPLVASIQAFAGLLEKSGNLQQVISNPALKSERSAVVDALLSRLKASDTAARLVRLLAENDRLETLPHLAQELQAQVDESLGQARVRLTSALALNDADRTRVTDALERGLGKPVVLDESVDPELIGGLVCEVGGVTLDTSLKRQLEKLDERIKSESATN